MPVSKPSRFSPSLKKRVFSQRRTISPSSSCTSRTAASAEAATEGGCDVEKSSGRARWIR